MGFNNKNRQGPRSVAWDLPAPQSPLVPKNGAQPSTYQPNPSNTKSWAAKLQQAQPSVGASTNYVPPHMRAGAKVTPSTMDQAVQALGSMQLQGRQIETWDASLAPAPVRPAITCHFPAPGQNSVATVALTDNKRIKWRKNAICVKSPWTRGTFNKGDILSVPYHVANMNPDCKEEDDALRMSIVGPVLSKRRMMVVLFKFKEVLFCAPVYSFTGRGLSAKPQFLVDQYIQVINVGDKRKLDSKGKYQPLVFQMTPTGKPLNEWTTVHITGGKTISWEEDIELCGRLTKDSHLRLVKIWRDFNKEAEQEACPWP